MSLRVCSVSMSWTRMNESCFLPCLGSDESAAAGAARAAVEGDEAGAERRARHEVGRRRRRRRWRRWRAERARSAFAAEAL